MAVETGKDDKLLGGLLSTLKEGVVIINEEGIVHSFNSKVKRLLGIQLQKGEDIFCQLRRREVIVLFEKTLQVNERQKFRMILDKLVFSFRVKKSGHYIIVSIMNVTEKAEYESYKSELMTAVTHELKTPLASILGYAEMLLSQQNEGSETDDHLRRIRNSAWRVNEMINDMLKLLRVTDLRFGETHNIDENVFTDTEELIAEFKDTFANDEKEVVFIRQTEEEFPVAYTHLFSIGVNLIKNAQKYSAGALIEVKFSRTSSQMEMSVADEGPIIPPDYRNRIFERFYVLSKSRGKAGTGLGLAIVKHSVKLYGGDILVGENKRGGNTFTVRFPVQKINPRME